MVRPFLLSFTVLAPKHCCFQSCREWRKLGWKWQIFSTLHNESCCRKQANVQWKSVTAMSVKQNNHVALHRVCVRRTSGRNTRRFAKRSWQLLSRCYAAAIRSSSSSTWTIVARSSSTRRRITVTYERCTACFSALSTSNSTSSSTGRCWSSATVPLRTQLANKRVRELVRSLTVYVTRVLQLSNFSKPKRTDEFFKTGFFRFSKFRNFLEN